MKYYFTLRFLRTSCWLLLVALTVVSVHAASLETLQGHVPSMAKFLTPTGRLPATNRLDLAIGLPLRNAAGLSNLLQEIYDPASPQYHHYLTPDQFTEQFGPTKQDYQAVIAFAKVNQLQVTATHPNRMLVDVRGSVADVEKALHVTLRTYQHPTEKRTFYAPDTEPALNLSVSVLHISGLDNYVLPHPANLKMTSPAANGSPTNGSGPEGAYIGKDFRAAYVPGVSLRGAGQSVGLVQFDSGYFQSDISSYEAEAGLSNVPVHAVFLDGYNGSPGFGNVEVSLDIEMVISMAPGVSNIYVFEGTATDDILNAMAASNQVRQLSASWSYSIDATTLQIFQQFAAQGQSFFNASGDSDAWTGAIPSPTDNPYITIVGGTTLAMNGTASSYNSETVWNWSAEPGRDGEGSGGGISTQYPIPAWQTNVSMTANQGSTTMRNVPDVAMTGDNVWVRFGGGGEGVYGGTSCAPPLWAAFAALVNQAAADSGHPPIGFINPAIYAIGAGPNYAACFHDTTTGNNTWSKSPSKFYAVPGYDLCTGWGTPVGQSLITALANPEPLLIVPATGFASLGGASGPFTVTSQNYYLTNSGTNTLTWSLANTSVWLNVSSTTGILTPAGPATTVSVSLNDTASNLVVGTYDATLWLTNVNDNVGQGLQFTLSVISPPTITQEPTNEAVLEGAMAIFNAQVTGGLPLTYQWQLNGTNLTDGGDILGSATTNLTIGDISAATVGTYTLEVTNFAGSVTSSNATLTITPSIPVIVSQPTNESVGTGDSAMFSVGVIGTTPFAYQWCFNGTNLLNETNDLLVITNVQLADVGNYAVLVTNALGSILSSNAALAITPCDPVPSGLVDWWPGEGNANDIAGTNNGTLLNGVDFTNGEVGLAFDFNGGADGQAHPSIDIPYISSLINPVYTVEAWIDPVAQPTNAENQGWVFGQSSGYLQMVVRSGTTGVYVVSQFASGGGFPGVVSTDQIPFNQFTHVAATWDGTTLRIYVNGSLNNSDTPGNTPGNSGVDFTIGSSGNGEYFNGAIDEVSYYSRALSAAEIQALYNAGSAGKCFTPMPPIITVQPASQTNLAGTAATFNVVAGGTAPLSYQWSFNSTNIAGATNTTLTLTDIQPGDSGNYTVLVTNAYGATNSIPAMLTVYGLPPFITMQPTNETNVIGTMAMFNVIAGGTIPLNYQWSFDDTNIAGATNATLILTNVQLSQSGNYSVLVTNDYGLTNSTVAMLEVVNPPPCDPVPSGLVDWWPGEGNANDIIGTNNGILLNGITFTNGEVGRAFDFTGGSDGSASPIVDIPYTPGLINPAYTVEAWVDPLAQPVNGENQGWIFGQSSGYLQIVVRPGTTGVYVVFQFASGGGFPGVVSTNQIPLNQFSHVAGTWDGATLRLYINGALNNAATPGSAPANSGVDFTIGSSGPGQYFNGPIDEVSCYNRALSAVEIQAIYISGGNGKCFTPILPFITTQPVSQTNVVGSTASFVVMAGGTGPLSYQWSFDGTNITSATNTTLTLTNVQLGQTGGYSVLVTNAYGSTNSSPAMLTVYGLPPFITTQPASETNVVGATVDFSILASGTAPLTYQWSFNGTNINGATNTSMMLANVQTNQSGNYSVLVTNAFGSTNSSVAVLAVVTFSTCDPEPSGLVDWWPGEGNAYDIIGTNNGTLLNNVTFTNGEVGQAFSFSGGADGTAHPSVDIPYTTGLINPVYTVEAWIDPAAQPSNGENQGWIFGQSSGYLQIVVRSGTTGVYVVAQFASGGGFPGVVSTNQTPLNQFSHVAATWDGTTLRLYVNGSLNNSDTPGNAPGNSGVDFTIGSSGDGEYFNGLIDEVSYYNRALSAGEIQTIYNAGSAGKCFTPTPPIITAQPASQTNLVGTTATFSVVAGGTAPLSYQWSFDSTNITGATNYTLTLTNVQTSQSGDYSVLVTNAYGSTNSSPAMFTVYALPPFITTQPVSETNVVGSTATFSILAGGTAPLDYQWSFDSTNITSATNATLILTDVQLNQMGNYSVVVTNAYGSTNSGVAVLSVVNPPPCDPVPSGLVDWWPAEGNANDIAGTNNGKLLNGVTFTNGEVGQAFSFIGGTDGATRPWVDIPYTAGLIKSIYTVEAWIDPVAQPVNGENQGWVFGQSSGYLQIVARSGTTGVYVVFQFSNGGGGFPGVMSTNQIPLNQFSHVAGTWDGTTLRLYINGALNNTATPGSTPANSGVDFTIGSSGPGQYFNGPIDEVSYYNRALSAAEIQAIYNTGHGGKCPLPPMILAQPTNLTAKAGATVQFNVNVNGSAPFYYQWTFNGTNVPSGTNASLSLTNVQLVQTGAYAVQISNAGGSTNSANATLTVQVAPTITSQPTNQFVGAGGSTSFSVTAIGTAPLCYQWQLNTTNVAGATNSMLTLANVQVTNAGNYSVTVTNLFGSITSSNAVLTVQVLPIITQSPYSRTNIAGSTATFTAAGIGALPLGYQWQKNGMPLNNGGNVAGSTNTSLTLTGVQDADAACYAMVVTNLAGSVTSSPAMLVVLDPPAITLQPTNQFVLVVSNAVIAAAVSGTAPLGCQWSFNGTNLSDVAGIIGSQGSVLTISNALVSDTGNYQLLVTNSLGFATSSVALLMVGTPPQIVTGPASESIPLGCTYNFSVTASGSQPLMSQWWKDGAALDGQTNSTITGTYLLPSDFGNYSVVVTNWFGSVTSAPAMLTEGYHPPVAGTNVVQRFAAGGVRIGVAELLADDVDTNGDALMIISVSSNSLAGGVVGLTNDWVYYAPPMPGTNADQFTYTVSDGHCETDTGTVLVQVMADNPQPMSFVIGSPASAPIQLSFVGIPGDLYQIEYADCLVNPNWQVLATQPADGFGVCQFTDAPPTNTARYYRALPSTISPLGGKVK